MIYDNPIFFEKNRVYRAYKGGALLGKFVSDGSGDGNYPEEWIASSVTAENPNPSSEKEGVSITDNGGFYLDDLIGKYPREILGEKRELGVLIKFLDSALRLPVQAHPDREFSLKYFNSTHGKEESWLILATRPGASVYFGFKDGVTREMFSKAVDQSETDAGAMERLLVKYSVKEGDVIFVPAKTVHAIGSGCLILEVQEPTDFTIQPEHMCGDIRLTEHEMYMGLDKNICLDCFKYQSTPLIKEKPITISENGNMHREMLIGKNQTENFGINRIILKNSSFTPDVSAGVYVVLSGNGTVTAPDVKRKINRGDYFLLPHNAVGKCVIDGNLTVAECFAQ